MVNKDKYITVRAFGKRFIECPICKEKFAEYMIYDHYEDVHVFPEIRKNPNIMLEAIRKFDLKLLENKNVVSKNQK